MPPSTAALPCDNTITSLTTVHSSFDQSSWAIRYACYRSAYDCLTAATIFRVMSKLLMYMFSSRTSDLQTVYLGHFDFNLSSFSLFLLFKVGDAFPVFSHLLLFCGLISLPSLPCSKCCLVRSI